jgi:hypothetical protein
MDLITAFNNQKHIIAANEIIVKGYFEDILNISDKKDYITDKIVYLCYLEKKENQFCSLFGLHPKQAYTFSIKENQYIKIPSDITIITSATKSFILDIEDWKIIDDTSCVLLWMNHCFNSRICELEIELKNIKNKFKFESNINNNKK